MEKTKLISRNDFENKLHDADLAAIIYYNFMDGIGTRQEPVAKIFNKGGRGIFGDLARYSPHEKDYIYGHSKSKVFETYHLVTRLYNNVSERPVYIKYAPNRIENDGININNMVGLEREIEILMKFEFGNRKFYKKVIPFVRVGFVCDSYYPFSKINKDNILNYTNVANSLKLEMEDDEINIEKEHRPISELVKYISDGLLNLVHEKLCHSENYIGQRVTSVDVIYN